MNVLLIVTGVAIVGELDLVGRLTLSEIILLPLAAIALLRERKVSNNTTWFYVFAVLWAFGAVAADLYNHSAFDDTVRGWAKIGFFIVNFTAIRFVVNRDIRRNVVLIVALFVGGAFRTMLGVGDEATQFDVLTGWKFGYGQLVSAGSLIASARLLNLSGSRVFAIGVPFCAAVIALVLNARNLAGVTAIATLVGGLTAGHRREVSFVHLAAFGAVTAVAGILFVSAYQFAAGEGLLGQEAQEKYVQQSQGNLGLLQAGRVESLASTQAIIDAPLFGHGSWARDISYVNLLADRLEAAGYKIESIYATSDLIPTHSHLLGAWVEHGIFGALFWAWAIWITVKAVMASVKRPTNMTSFLIFIGCSMIWDIAFSPFGLERRVITAAWLNLMILVGEAPVVSTLSNANRVMKKSLSRRRLA